MSCLLVRGTARWWHKVIPTLCLALLGLVAAGSIVEPTFCLPISSSEYCHLNPDNHLPNTLLLVLLAVYLGLLLPLRLVARESAPARNILAVFGWVALACLLVR